MPSLGTGEIIVIFVLVLVLFGPNRLPELARGLGKGMREIRKVTAEFQNQLSLLAEEEDDRPAKRPAATTTATAPAPRLDQMNLPPSAGAVPAEEAPAAPIEDDSQPSLFGDETFEEKPRASQP